MSNLPELPDFELIASMLEYRNSWEPDAMKLEANKLRAYTRALASPDTAGWQLVPVEPTIAMCRAGLSERHDDLAKSIYKAMLSAAPQPPKEAI